MDYFGIRLFVSEPPRLGTAFKGPLELEPRLLSGRLDPEGADPLEDELPREGTLGRPLLPVVGRLPLEREDRDDEAGLELGAFILESCSENVCPLIITSTIS